MHSIWLLVLASLAALSAAGPVRAGEKEIERLIRELGSDVFKERQAARKRLEEIGEPALDALRKAKATLELRRRADDIVVAIEDRVYGPELRLIGHAARVNGVAISADGKRVLTASDDRTLRLWDAYTGKSLQILTGHTSGVRCATLSADGKQALSGGDDHTVRLWDVTTAKELKTMVGHNVRVSCVAFGPEGKAISGGGDTAILWDLPTGNRIAALSPDSSSVYSVAYSAMAGRAAIGGQHLDRSMRAWNLETREARLLARQPSTYGVTIGFSPDGGKMLALDRWSVRIHDAASGKELKEVSLLGTAQLKKAKQPLFAALAPDGQWAVTGDFTSLSSWDLSTGKEFYTAKALRDFFGAPTCVAFLPNGRRIACAAVNGTVHIFRVPR